MWQMVVVSLAVALAVVYIFNRFRKSIKKGQCACEPGKEGSCEQIQPMESLMGPYDKKKGVGKPPRP